MSRSLFLSIAAIAALGVSGANAADLGASRVTKLFMDACVPNIGESAKVRAWAEAQHFQEIKDPAPLSVFVGPGDQGAAWAVPTKEGGFAVSIRGKTRACAVWAQFASPSESEAYFRQIVEGARRPGVEVNVFQDTTTATGAGQVRTLIYKVGSPDSPKSFVFTLQTAERPNGAFQVSMQVAFSGRAE